MIAKYRTRTDELWIKNMRAILLIVVLALLTPLIAQAQDFERIRSELRARQEQTNREIQSLQRLILNYEQQIRESDNRYETLYREYQALEREILLRDAVISTLQTQGRQLNEEISLIQREFNRNKAELERLIENYKKSLTYLYKHGRIPEIAYLLTSGSFNQMLVRSFYLRKFEEQRTRQARQIAEAQEELRRKEEELIAAREDVQKNLQETRQARQNLDETRQRQNRTITQLQQDRRQTQDKLRQTRREVNDLNQILNNTIAELERVQREEQERIQVLEAERLRRLAEAQRIQDPAERERAIARYSTPVTGSDLIPSRDALNTLEASFLASKGKMNWPVRNGVITARFGNIVDAVTRTQVPNPGIEISTEPGSPVYATHDGYVSGIFRAFGYDNLVIVNHGRYLTVYANMSEVTIPLNMFVRAGDMLGRSGTENSAKGSTLVFIVRDGSTNLNPSDWITPRQAASRP